MLADADCSVRGTKQTQMNALRRLGFVLLLLLVPVAFVLHVRCGNRPSTGGGTGDVAATSFDPWDSPIDPQTRLLVLGGGGEPDSTEVQLEADVRLATETYAGRSLVLFAGGSERATVRELAGSPGGDPLFEALSQLFLGREHGSSLRAPRIPVDAPATYENLMRSLDELLLVRGQPLTFLVATHGTQAEDPMDGAAVLWGNEGLFVRDLVDLLGQPSTARPVRMVVASCFGGAFGAIGSIEARGEEPLAMHCGVFATDANHLASGCDPDPNRARHEGYLLHYLAALRGRTSGGIELAGIDLDQDGRISMLEAHTRARLASDSFDVPSTSSESFVRDTVAALEIAWQTVPPATLVDDAAVVAALSQRLQIPNEAVANAASMSVGQSLDEREEGLADAEALRDIAWNRLRVALLERWPWLEDAYHVAWAEHVAEERRPIEAMLTRSALAIAYREAEADAAALAEELDELRIRDAMLQRLVRAYELPRMVAALHQQDEARYRRFLALRACEGHVPGTR